MILYFVKVWLRNIIVWLQVKSHHKSLGKQIQAIISDVKSKQELSRTIQG